MSGAALDPNVLQTLRDLDEGDPGFLKGVLQEYAAQLAKTEADLRAAMAGRDAHGFSRIAHSLKGASSTTGANDVLALAKQLEVEGGAGRWDAIETLLAAFARESARAQAEIHALVG